MLGPYGWCFAVMVACNVLMPQLFWFRWFRTTPWVMFIISIFINFGMWFERFVIVATSLSRDYLPSSWKPFHPTSADVLQLLGGFGLFSTFFLLFVRFLPMIALSEVKACLPAAAPRHRAAIGERLEGGKPMSTIQDLEPDRAGPLYGALARFVGPAELLDAVERLHARGYRRLDAYSPFPIHGMDQALRAETLQGAGAWSSLGGSSARFSPRLCSGIKARSPTR